MDIFICQVSIAPVRSSSSDKSEMVTQLLFGETVEVLEKRGTWRKIKCTWDNYIGWTDHKLLKQITPSEYERSLEDQSYSLELAQGVMAEDYFIPIVLGSTLPEYDGMRLSLGDTEFVFNGQAITPKESEVSLNLLLKIARKYLNAPYLWGGRSPFGIDCSGFTQTVFKLIGIKLLRDASQQVNQGRIIDFVELAQPGDLAFFENKAKRIAHVGLLLPENKIIHASGKVRIDQLDHYGIFNEETQKYTHRLRVIKRVLPDEMPKTTTQEIEEEIKIENQIDLF